jgi:hypothetical protein
MSRVLTVALGAAWGEHRWRIHASDDKGVADPMSRFLFTTMPATGHITPKLPIAVEVAR